MTVMVPDFVTSTMVSIIDLVPVSNLDISKTPIGPFQMIVFDDSIAAALSLIDSGPQSSPMKPSGTPSALVAFLTSPSSPNLEETTKSIGRMISTPLALAFSMISGTILAPSSSQSDEPIAMPSMTLRKVYAMPPPMMSLSTLSSMFLMSRILSETLAPPRMASTGFTGASSTLPNASSSFATSRPAARIA